MQVHIQVNCHFGKSVFQDRTTVMADEVTNLLTKEHCAINSDDEVAPLLVKKTSSTWWSRCVLRYKTTRKCVSSKSALLILFWSFVLGLWNGVALNPDLYLRNFTIIYTLAGYGFVALVLSFFPLAGFLADVKYGRYKVVVRSLCIFLISVPPFIIIGGTLSASALALTNDDDGRSICDGTCIAVLTVIYIVFLLIFVASYVGLVGFTANVIQFGMDQLHDSPGEDRTLFIHWYVWVYFVTIVIGQLAWNLAIQIPYNDTDLYYIIEWYNVVGYVLLGIIPIVVIISLIVTLCLAKRRKNWFLIEPGTVNPYKLVYVSLNLLANTRPQCVAVPSLTVRMRSPQDWTLARRSMEVPSAQNRWRMLRCSMEY